MLLRRATLLLCGIPAALAPLAGPGEPPAHDPRGLDPTDFVHAVLPVLQRQGCASAYCHGAATGQGGFKLSLFGGDPQADHAAITRALGGRRLDLLAPEASLLLAKPLRLVDHGGGKRLTEDSEQHALLRAWIAAGAPFAPEVPRRLVDLQVAPDGGRLVVTATFAAGGTTTTADVTALATFSSSAQDVATVDRAGRFAIVGPGEAHLFTRYAGATARVTVGRPFGDEVAVEGTAREGDLDALFAARLADLGLAPAPEAPPERIARRLWLDLVERPPTAFELQRFLEMPEGERIARAADALLATPEFAVAAARRLRAFFEVPEVEDAPPGARAAVVALHQRVRAAAEADEPLPDLTRDLLAHGGPFLARREDPRDRAELVARTMFGVRLGCARCHDHPDDRWRQRDHLAFAACFAPPPRGARAPSSLFDEHTGEPVVPRLLPLRGADEHGAGDLHAFVHSRAHDAFARAFANRVFAWLLGAGLVEPLDDHRETNPARHEAWLEALVAQFHAGGRRLRPLVRAIVTWRAYRLDAAPEGDPLPRARWFAARDPKPLDDAVLERAAAAVLAADRAVFGELPSSPLARRLAILHGEGLARAVHAPGNAIDALVQLCADEEEQLDELFRACLSRPPSTAERAAFLPGLQRGEHTLHDLAHALLLGREFEFLR